MKPTAGRPQAIAPADVEQCQAKGMTQQQTAAALGVSLSSVQRYWKRAEQRGRPQQSPHTAKVAALMAEGMTTGQIAKAIGIDRTTVNRIKQKITAA